MLQEKYLLLGGKIRFNAKVTQIITADKKVTGIIVGNHEKKSADIVIAAGDLFSTCFSLLPKNLVKNPYTNHVKNHKLFPGTIQISLGIKGLLNEVCHKLVIPLAVPFACGTDTISDMMVRVGNFDPSFAPPMHTAIIVHLRTHDPHYWILLREKDSQEYDKQKKRITETVISSLKKRFGEIFDSVVVSDVATPATYVRYNSVYNGSYQGFAPTPQLIGKSFSPCVQGLKNCYLTGQWVVPPGGLPRVIIASRHVAQIVCSKDKKSFQTADM